MKSLILSLALIVSAPAFACEEGHADSASATTGATATVTVKGMHCDGCRESVESRVCKMPNVATCKVEITNAKKQLGKITLTTTSGANVDAEGIKNAVKDAGYEVSKLTVK